MCVLGCRPGSHAFARRARAARDAFRARPAPVVVACGGRAWAGRVEADVLAGHLEDGGVPAEVIVRERSSLDTRGNARHAAELLAQKGIRDVALVTCTWHLPRAERLFERAGLRVIDRIGAPPPNPTAFERLYWAVRERLSTWKDVLR